MKVLLKKHTKQSNMDLSWWLARVWLYFVLKHNVAFGPHFIEPDSHTKFKLYLEKVVTSIKNSSNKQWRKHLEAAIQTEKLHNTAEDATSYSIPLLRPWHHRWEMRRLYQNYFASKKQKS